MPFSSKGLNGEKKKKRLLVFDECISKGIVTLLIKLNWEMCWVDSRIKHLLGILLFSSLLKTASWARRIETFKLSSFLMVIKHSKMTANTPNFLCGVPLGSIKAKTFESSWQADLWMQPRRSYLMDSPAPWWPTLLIAACRSRIESRD